MTETEIGQDEVVQIAKKLIEITGDNAASLITGFIENSDPRSEAGKRRRAVLEAIIALKPAVRQANTRNAASDGIDDASAGSLAHHAIESGKIDESYYRRRARQHLELADRAVDIKVKSTHLDFASRYATLRELAVRENHKIEHSPGLEVGAVQPRE